jgi:transcriptional regulator GlxA family with amidase domain
MEPVLHHALSLLVQAKGSKAVSAVVEEVGISPRRLTRSLREYVGFRPKLLCRLLRFNHALQALEARPDVDRAEVALSCGYFDQSHFNHEFRTFAGMDPTTYLHHRISRTHVAVPK